MHKYRSDPASAGGCGCLILLIYGAFLTLLNALALRYNVHYILGKDMPFMSSLGLGFLCTVSVVGNFNLFVYILTAIAVVAGVATPLIH
jgi:hypothetical protein